jgi:undecaprenyl phosphate-alpha-L-ara4FN deformylase
MHEAAEAGHEVGLHAWDHHAWQMGLERMDAAAVRRTLVRGHDDLARILGRPPDCSAAAGWRCDETVLLEKEAFSYRYGSDCRGESIFRPRVGETLCAPQIPTTLPTYDEVIGRDGVSDESYNDDLLSRIRRDRLNVLTVHAEVEGIARADLFAHFLDLAHARDMQLLPLGRLLPPEEEIPPGRIRSGTVSGREGQVCLQAPL